MPIVGQSSTASKSPEEVVRAFRKMKSAGGRLTAPGWYRASQFFSKPEVAPRTCVFGVMYSEEIYHSFIRGNKAEVWSTREAIGQIDALARFTFVVAPGLRDRPRPRTEPVMPHIHGLS